jgi:glycosyltransferase involved in cell wall biosynthesis
MDPAVRPEVSVIVPARNEKACLAECLRSLLGQSGIGYEVLVVDDHSTDGTRGIAESFGVCVVAADRLPPGWSGKCNAAATGARAAKGKWLLFTDADTKHQPDSIATGLREAAEHGAALLSYSPKQEVHSLAERMLMPLIFADLAAAYPPKDVCDPGSTVAAANGQYLLVRRDAYDVIGGHAAVAKEILEDVALAKRAKQAGYKLQFRWSDVVSTRMYRSFPQMWEGWTKNLALLFPKPLMIAFGRLFEFALIAFWMALACFYWITGELAVGSMLLALAVGFFAFRLVRIRRRAHFDWLSSALAVFGLPLYSILLLNSYISHKRGMVSWKGRTYRSGMEPCGQGSAFCQGTTSVVPTDINNELRL